MSLSSIFLIRVSNPFPNVCRLSFILSDDILLCSNSLQIFSKSAFSFGFSAYADYNLKLDSSTMLLFR